MLAMSEDEVEELLAGAHEGMSSGLLALAGGWPAVIGLASLTMAEIPLPDDGLDLPHQLYEFFADEVYRALEPDSRIGAGPARDRPESRPRTGRRAPWRRASELASARRR